MVTELDRSGPMAGVGGWSLGGVVLGGFGVVCAIDASPCSKVAVRQVAHRLSEE